ncbi:hypothetical protein MNBD_GAMMA21-2508 [hydrothermal vent metagenome]|uniref:ChrR-like cupin domain-containing protein n=1 Tax=hydrothermal vent metagenome TaxID=652676 RepID=A0A3B1AGK1_9ZZZZ
MSGQVTGQSKQVFIDDASTSWQPFGAMTGVSFISLAEPVPEGSIHRAKLTQGTIIPCHTHPVDEFVFVLSGTLETGGRRCEAGTFWTTPAHTRQGPHVAITETEIITIRLGALGEFEP